MRLAFVVGAVLVFANTAVAGPILVIDNVKTSNDGGSFEILASFESPADPPCLIGAYSIALRVDHFDGIDSPFFFESHNIEPRMVKLGEGFGTTPPDELSSGDYLQIVALSNGNGAVPIEGGTRLARVDFTTTASTDYAFDVTFFEDSQDPNILTRLGNKTPEFTSATIAFTVPEPTNRLGLLSIVALCVICRLRIARR